MSPDDQPTTRIDTGEPVKYMDVKAFRKEGYLLEVNRRFLHPLGLALEVVQDQTTGKERLGGVWDYRGDPGGIVYAELDAEDAEKIAAIADLEAKRGPARVEACGYWIQPKPEL